MYRTEEFHRHFQHHLECLKNRDVCLVTFVKKSSGSKGVNTTTQIFLSVFCSRVFMYLHSDGPTEITSRRILRETHKAAGSSGSQLGLWERAFCHFYVEIIVDRYTIKAIIQKSHVTAPQVPVMVTSCKTMM